MVSVQHFDGQRDALTTAHTQRDQAAREPVAAHRVDKIGSQYRARRPDRVAVGDSAAFDIDDVFGQAEFTSDNDGDRGEGFIDLDTFDRANIPGRRAATPA